MKLKRMFQFTIVAVLAMVFSFQAFGQCDPGMAENKAKFKLLSNEKKAQVWKYQLTLRLDTEALTPQQRAKIIEAIGYLNADFYKNKNAARIKTLSEDLLTVFSKEEFHRYFQTLGTASEMYFAKVKLSADFRPDCTCNMAAAPLCDRCEWTMSTSCVYQDWGCGPFWVLQCDGNCKNDPPPNQ